MNSEIITGYKRVLTNLVNAIGEEQVEYMLTMLENIPDEASELRGLFDKDEGGLRPPNHWIGVLRFMRFGLGLKNDLMSEYDSFVEDYQSLSSKAERNTDEEKLVAEIGDFLFKVDEQLGDQERLIQKLIVELNKTLVEKYGMQFSPAEGFYRAEMDREACEVLNPLLLELMEISRAMSGQVRLMKVLVRIRRLILDKNS